MKECKIIHCNNTIEKSMIINGVNVLSRARLYCYICVPPGEKPSKDLIASLNLKYDRLLYKLCSGCMTVKEKSEFYNKKATSASHHYCKCCCVFSSKMNKKDKKFKAVEYKGGECSYCGYSKCMNALDFHHLDPTQKDYSLAEMLYSGKTWEQIKNEIDKCIILCSNCHREEHARINVEKSNVGGNEFKKKRVVYPSDLELENMSKTMTLKDISIAVGVCHSRICDVFKERGLIKHSPFIKNIIWPDNGAIIDLLNVKTVKEISKFLCVKVSVFRDYCKDQNIELPAYTKRQKENV